MRYGIIVLWMMRQTKPCPLVIKDSEISLVSLRFRYFRRITSRYFQNPENQN